MHATILRARGVLLNTSSYVCTDGHRAARGGGGGGGGERQMGGRAGVKERWEGKCGGGGMKERDRGAVDWGRGEMGRRGNGGGEGRRGEGDEGLNVTLSNFVTACLCVQDLEIAADFKIMTTIPELFNILKASDHVRVVLPHQKVDKMIFVPEGTSENTE